MKISLSKIISSGAAALLFALPPTLAQMPGGSPLPNYSLKSGDIHGGLRVDYYAVSSSYRFQGEYNITANFANLAGSPLYVFADVDVETLSGAGGGFQPDRQTGTFEVGANRVAGISPLTLFVRHQSPHNIDRSDRRQGSFEMVGARWTKLYRGTDITFSTGPYVHRIVNQYTWDADLQTQSRLGEIAGRPWELHADLHEVFTGDSRGSFTDVWIETGVLLTRHIEPFFGGGSLHDVDVYNGRSNTPIVVGVKLLF